MKKFINILLVLTLMYGSILTIGSYAVNEEESSTDNTLSLSEFTSLLSEINAEYPPVPVISVVDAEFDMDFSSELTNPEEAEEPPFGIKESLENNLENKYETMRLIV